MLITHRCFGVAEQCLPSAKDFVCPVLCQRGGAQQLGGAGLGQLNQAGQRDTPHQGPAHSPAELHLQNTGKGLEGGPSTCTGQGHKQEPVLQAGNRKSYSWGAGQENSVHPPNAELFPI